MEEIKQHQKMARSGEPYAAESFGVGPLPGTAKIPGDTAVMGKELSESDRAVGDLVHMGSTHMGASRNPDHGPHKHREAW